MNLTTTRRGFTMSDHRTILLQYATTPAVELAALLGRSVGSLYQYTKRHPELQKRPRG